MASGGGLPESFIEALYGVEAMANEYGKARLIRAVEEAGLALENIQPPGTGLALRASTPNRCSMLPAH